MNSLEISQTFSHIPHEHTLVVYDSDKSGRIVGKVHFEWQMKPADIHKIVEAINGARLKVDIDPDTVY